MLAAGQRLRRSSDFAAAVRGGRRAGRGALVVHVSMPSAWTQSDQPAQAGGDLAPARAGFVVSRAVGSAVTRNTVRRRLRHLVRERLPRLPPGTTLVVRSLPAAASASYAQLGADLDAALAVAWAGGRGRRRASTSREDDAGRGTRDAGQRGLDAGSGARDIRLGRVDAGQRGVDARPGGAP